jgi:hypothetical protein
MQPTPVLFGSDEPFNPPSMLWDMVASFHSQSAFSCLSVRGCLWRAESVRARLGRDYDCDH